MSQLYQRGPLVSSGSLEESIPNQEDESTAKPGPPSKVRLHFLDWMRFVMIGLVVFAHTTVSGTNVGGIWARWRVDDATLIEEPDYREAMYGNGTDQGPTPPLAKCISILRQWCLPMLFWISGASLACSYRGGLPRGLERLLGFAALGMLSNAGLWFSSPQNSCTVGDPKCKGEGMLFDFSICGQAGWSFAIVFQMWYVLLLVFLILLDWPLFLVVHGTGGLGALCLQWVLNMAFYSLSGGLCRDPYAVLGALGVSEALFLLLVGLDAPLLGRRWQQLAGGLPLRLLHYLLAGVTLFQFGATPFATKIEDLSPAYLAFVSVGFKRFFDLGFLLTHARQGPEGDRVQPLASRAWPFLMVWWVWVAPSTNWQQAGMLTYPFFSDRVQRCSYITGAIAITFVFDRVSRGVGCDALPPTLGHAGLLLFLFHPWAVTVLLALGLRSVMWISAGTIIGTVVAVWVGTAALPLCRGGQQHEKLQDQETSSSSE